MEKAPCNYFVPVMRNGNGKQIIWKEGKAMNDVILGFRKSKSSRAAILTTLPQPALVRGSGKILL